jgi:hypothetical protein
MSAVEVVPRRKDRVATNLAILYGAQLITGLLSLAPIAFVPHYLDAASIGRLVIANAFAGILTKLIC